MTTSFAIIASFLLGWVLRATVVLVFAWILAVAFRRASAAQRALVWRIAFVAVLILPVLTLVAPSLPLAWEGAPSGILASPTSAPDSPGNLAASGSSIGSPGPESARGGPLNTPRAPAAGGGRWIGVLLAAWATVAAVGLCRVLGAVMRVRRLARETPEADAAWTPHLDDACHLQGLATTPDLRVGAAVAFPFTWAPWPWSRGVIFLPASARTWTAATRRGILGHEAAHVARRDGAFALLGRTLATVLWFHPLVWWALHRLSRETEAACDDRVLLAGERPSDYAEDLLSVSQGRSRIPAVALGCHTHLGQRLEAILEPDRPRHGPRRRRALLLATAMFAGTGVLAGMRAQDRVVATVVDALGGREARVQEAVDRGLAWLAQTARPEGGWSETIGYKFNNVYKTTTEGFHVGVTAMALLAFLEAGHRPDKGPYGVVMRRGTDLLVASVEPTGWITSGGTRMRSHGLALLYLVRLQAKVPSEAVSGTIGRALRLTVQGQNDDGGWRYLPNSLDSDILCTVVQMRALEAAQEMGLERAGTTLALARARAYVARCRRSEGSPPADAFAYQARERARVSVATSGAGAWASLGAGVPHLGDILHGLAEDTLKEDTVHSSHFLAWEGRTYAALALHRARGNEAGVKRWDAWKPKMDAHVLAAQNEEGWWPKDVGPGKAYTTASACLLLMLGR